ncbi:unnamed protein product [Lactuca virosa]|uniref:Uncharacterized protein n=1 Tax=Lactuca virosa TaxID=75947 RepID=A0AAU9NQL2_9ASTR|nr:unnamed protein product [Lactuca virosa]
MWPSPKCSPLCRLSGPRNPKLVYAPLASVASLNLASIGDSGTSLEVLSTPVSICAIFFLTAQEEECQRYCSHLLCRRVIKNQRKEAQAQKLYDYGEKMGREGSFSLNNLSFFNVEDDNQWWLSNYWNEWSRKYCCCP